jgi:hypothetical protein
VLDIDSLEVTTPCAPEKKSDEIVDYKQQYEILKVKHDDLWRQYNTVMRIYSSELARAWHLLDKTH